MIFADAPAVIAPQLVRTAIMVWGDAQAMTRLKLDADAHGWLTSWATDDKRNFSLYIAVDDKMPKDDIRKFIDAVNRKEFGALNAGFANIGDGQR